MRIAVVFDGLGIGGIERVGINYIKLLIELGHDVDIINLNPKQTCMEKMIPKKCRLYHETFSKKLTPEYYEKLIKYAWWGRFIYPIVFLCIQLIYGLYKILIVFKYRRIKYDVAIAFSGHFNDLTYISENFVKTKKKVCWLHGSIIEYALISDGYINLYKKIKNLVVLSDELQEKFFQSNKFIRLENILNIKKIYNPIFVEEKLSPKDRIDEIKNMYGLFGLMVARFTYPKDFKTVIDAVKILREQYSVNFNVLFVGDGPDYFTVQKYAAKNELLNRGVYFIGATLDVKKYYEAAHLFILSSLEEGLPTVVLEAMNFGLPVISTDCKFGAREILKDSEYGIIIPVKNPKKMAESIATILDNKEMYVHYQKKGAERLESFRPLNIKKQLDEYMNNLI